MSRGQNKAAITAKRLQIKMEESNCKGLRAEAGLERMEKTAEAAGFPQVTNGGKRRQQDTARALGSQRKTLRQDHAAVG